MTITIQQAIDTILRDVPGAPFSDTVDIIKRGDPEQEVSAVAVTFLANGRVIQQAVDLGANFIITHEPVFYNHLDETEWLKQDPVFQSKRDLVDSHNLVLWRFHDYLHSVEPDSTVMGLVEALGWESYLDQDQPFFCRLPGTTLGQITGLVQERLNPNSLRVVGNLDMDVRGVAVIPGAPGFQWQIAVLQNPDVDVIITGEINEWETSEYVRDANEFGVAKGLIVTGHAASEEAGMRRIIPWLEERLPGIPVHFISNDSAFQPV